MRWPLLWASTLLWGATHCFGQGYPAPGFDCANATTPQELRICRSPALADLDGRHWYLAERAIKGSRDPEATRSGVESWIAQVRDVCETDKCLVDAYTARNAQLEREVAALAPMRAPPMPAGLPEPVPLPAVETKPAIDAPAPPVPALPPAATATTPKPADARAPATEPEESAVPWPWLLAAALIAALGVRWLLSARGARTGRGPPAGRE